VTPAAKDGLPRWVKLRPQDAPLAWHIGWTPGRGGRSAGAGFAGGLPHALGGR